MFLSGLLMIRSLFMPCYLGLLEVLGKSEPKVNIDSQMVVKNGDLYGTK